MDKVSVIIPTFNRSQTLVRAIKSVLSQTHKNLEIIVVDDGSSDDTRNQVLQLKQQYPAIRYHYQTNSGNAAARNTGINLSTGVFIAPLDDDEWLPERVEKGLRYFDMHPDVVLVFSKVIVVNSFGETIRISEGAKSNKPTFFDLLEFNCIFHNTVLLRKDVVVVERGYDPLLLVAGDYDLWLRLAKKHPIGYIEEPLAKYYVHENNFSNNTKRSLKDHEKIFSKKEILGELSRRTRNEIFAKLYYQHGVIFEKNKCYGMAVSLLFRSIVLSPMVGAKHCWPREVSKFRFTKPYRVIKVYFILVNSVIRFLWQFFTKKIIFSRITPQRN